MCFPLHAREKLTKTNFVPECCAGYQLNVATSSMMQSSELKTASICQFSLPVFYSGGWSDQELHPRMTQVSKKFIDPALTRSFEPHSARNYYLLHSFYFIYLLVFII